MSTELRVSDSDVVVEQLVRRPHDCVHCCLVTSYGDALKADPSGLTDNADEHHELQIRLETIDKNPIVAIWWARYERSSDGHTIMPYEEFWDLLVNALTQRQSHGNQDEEKQSPH